ncbi:MAG: LysR family transcriptional regulator [Micavibrio aeruginosavorus]|uniref:LysR family transcriptional regulator n=1 Tax=Micavibrio aeruginosavorus TaxID=349221 RepID=A0A2W4ZJP4_9BACT|nr:MAG: LysR family transcriptional regulator [Micavibrio aeruginosavorus]
MDKFANMQAFQSVAESGSFAEAARRLNLANSVVSKRIKDLEDFLGTQLFRRTTRQVSLTETGQSYLDYVQRVMDELEEVESGIRYQTEKPVGTIKLTAPMSFGLQALAPAITSYLQKYPGVSIKTYLSDRRVDLITEGYDLAIRIGTLEDTTLIAKKLGRSRRIVCASPGYFKKNVRPERPSDLKKHNCLSYINLADGKAWPFWEKDKKIWQPVSGNFMSDNGDLLYQAALSGCGITMLPAFIIGDALKQKSLVPVLEDFEDKNFDIYAVYLQTRHLSTKIRTLIDHLSKELCL